MGPVCYGIPGWGEDMIWLSHWKLEDQLEGGDEVIVSVCVQHDEFQFEVEEWGVEVVQEEPEESMSSTRTQHNTTDPHVIGGDFSSYEVQKMPGTYWLLCYTPATVEKLASERPTLFNNLSRDSDEHTDKEQEEQEKKSEHQMLAETRADSNNCRVRVWKVLTIVAGFIQFFLSPIWYRRMSNNSSTKDSGDDDDNDMKPEGGDDNVDQDRNPSVSIDTKTNEIFERRFIGSASSRSNEEFQSVVKNVSDEEYLMQCLEILNKMEEIDDDSYSKALKLFHGDATWRKIFVVMPCKRRKNFILKL